MADPQFRPIPGDPSAADVTAMFDATSEDWLLTAGGDYITVAVQTFLKDGSGFQVMIAVEWPVRRNHSAGTEMLRLMISPEDALGFAQALTKSASWLIARDAMGLGGRRDN